MILAEVIPHETPARTAPGALPRPETDEQALIRRCRAGERRAFEPLVRRYQERAYYFALGLVGNGDDARELSQDAFARAFLHFDKFRAGLPFYPWFHRILRNLCLDHLARRGRRGEAPLVLAARVPAEGPEANPEEAAAEEERRSAVWQAIEELSSREREIIVMREFQGLSYEEMARLLECPRGTVMSRLFYARRHLREKLNGRI